MSEIRKEVKVFIVNKVCDECTEGIMIKTGVNILTEPIQIKHTCNQCGHEETYFEQYPKMEYEYID